MNKINKLNKNDFNNLLKNLVKIGAGSESVVYRLNKNFILKDLMDESLMEVMHEDNVILQKV